MFGWRMEEEVKLEFTITVNWRREDGSIATTQLGTLRGYAEAYRNGEPHVECTVNQLINWRMFGLLPLFSQPPAWAEA
jgi:hypothetical protein